MSGTVEATARDEVPVFFPAGPETLFGIVTRPTVPNNGTAVVVLAGAGQPAAASRTAFTTRLCRALAAQGYSAMRFDYHGVGESTGGGRFRLDRPYVDDLLGAVSWIEGQGISSFVLVGLCYGAVTALASAGAVKDLGGMVLLSVPVRAFNWRKVEEATDERGVREWVGRALRLRVARELLDRDRRRTYARMLRAKLEALSGRRRPERRRSVDRTWVNPRFLDQVNSLVDRHVPTLFVYGEDDEYYEDFRLARSGRLGRILERAGPTVEVVTLPGQVHAFPRPGRVEELVGVIDDWLARGRASREPWATPGQGDPGP